MEARRLEGPSWEEILERMVEVTHDGIIVVRRDGRIEYANSVAGKIFGVGRAEIMGRLYNDSAWKITTIQGEPYPEENLPFMIALRTGMPVDGAELAISRPDGSRIIVSVNAAPIRNKQGIVVGAVVSLADISSQRKAEIILGDSERRFREILEKADLVAVILDLEGNILFANDFLLNLTGRRQEEIIGRNWLDTFIPPENQKEIQWILREVRQKGVPTRYENDILTREGERRTISFNNIVLRDSRGNMVGVASIGEDVTELRRTKEALAEAYQAERTVAETIQEALLTVPQKIEGVDFGYLYRPATEAARVGGDFYDLFELEEGKVGIVIGDVSGKGLAAAALTSLVKNTVRAYSYEGDSPSTVMAKTNNVVRRTPTQAMFVTVFFGILDTRSGTITYCSAGHPPGILKRKTERTSFLITGSPVIGAFSGLMYIDDEEVLEKGDILILYTNGVTDVRCDRELFGEERLVSFIKSLRPVPAKEVTEAIFNEVKICSGGKLVDDIVLLTISLSG